MLRVVAQVGETAGLRPGREGKSTQSELLKRAVRAAKRGEALSARKNTRRRDVTPEKKGPGYGMNWTVFWAVFFCIFVLGPGRQLVFQLASEVFGDAIQDDFARGNYRDEY